MSDGTPSWFCCGCESGRIRDGRSYTWTSCLLVGLSVEAAVGVCEIDGAAVGLNVKEGANVGQVVGLAVLIGFAEGVSVGPWLADGAAETETETETVESKVGLFVVPMDA